MKKNIVNIFFILILFLVSCKQVDISTLKSEGKLTNDQALPYKSILFEKLGNSSLIAPGALKVQLNSLKAGNVAEINWKNADGAVAYHLYRAEDNGGVPGTFVKLADVKGDSYSDEIVLGDKGSITYHYRVCSVNSQGTVSAPSSIVQISVSEDSYDYTVNSVIVSKGVGFQPTEADDVLSANSIQISWKKVKDAQYYKIFRYVDGKDPSTGRFVESHFVPTEPLNNEYSFFDRNPTYPTLIGVIYKYHVVPVNMRNVMGGGDILANQSDTGYLPPRPYGVQASQGKQGGGVDVSWEYENSIDGLDITSFCVKRSVKRNSDYEILAGGILPGTQTYFDSTASADGDGKPQKFFYKVCARYGQVESVGSEPVNGIAVSADALCPPNGYAISASKSDKDGTYNNIVISWPKINGAGKYIVYKGFNSNGPFAKLKEITAESIQPENYSLTFLTSKDGDLETYEIDGLTHGKHYYFTVSCIASSGPGAGLEGAMSDYAGGYTIRAPESLSVERNDDNTVTVAWTNPEDLSGYIKAEYYQVLRSSDGSDYKAVSGRLSKSEFVDTSVESGKSYLYKVASFVSSTQRSAFAGPVSIVLMGAPSNITAQKAVTGDSLTVNWTAVTDAECTGYRIYKNNNLQIPEKGVAFIAVDGKDSASYVDSELSSGENYFYRVSAVFNIEGKIVEGNISKEFDFGYKLGVSQQVIATDGTYNDKIVVRWTGVEGAKTYKIKADLKDGLIEFSDPLDPDSADSNICTIVCPPNQRYDISVAAVNENNELGTYSVLVSGSTFQDVSLLPAPKNVAAGDFEFANQVSLSWTPLTSADLGGSVFSGYEIYINNKLSFTMGGLDTSNVLVAIENEKRGQSLLFSIKALGTIEGNPKLGIMSDYDYGSTLGCPQNVIASDGMYGDKIKVSWDKVEGAVKYQVFYREFDGDYTENMVELNCSDSGFDAENPSCDFNNSGNIAEIVGKVMFFQVKAFDEAGADNIGAEDSGYILGVPETIESFDVPSFDTISVTWDKVANADDYRILRTKTPADTSSWNVVNVSVTDAGDNKLQISDDTIQPFHKYYYTVQAKKDSGEGYIDYAKNASGYIVSSPVLEVNEYGVTATQSEAGENGTGVTVSWNIDSLPGDCTDFAFVIDVVESRAGGNSWSQTVTDRTVTDIRFDGLVSGTECKVTAKAKIGDDFSADLADGADDDALADNQKVFSPVLNSPLLTASNGAYKNPADNIDLSWTSLSKKDEEVNIIEYVLYRTAEYKGKDTIWTKVLTEQENPEQIYAKEDPSSDLVASAYFYKVVSVNKHGFEGQPRYIAHAYNVAPKVIADATKDWDNLEDRIELSWNHIPGVDYYVLEASYLNGSMKSVSSHFVPSVGYGEIAKFNFTGIGSDPLKYGYYSFNIVPCASKKQHSTDSAHDVLAECQGEGFLAGELKGAKHMTDEYWINYFRGEIQDITKNYVKKIGPDLDSIDKNTWHDYATSGGKVRMWRNHDSDWGGYSNYTFDMFVYDNASYNNVMNINGSLIYLYLFTYSFNKIEEYGVGVSCTTPPSESDRGDYFIKNEDWIEVTGAYEGKILIHSDLYDCWDRSTGDGGHPEGNYLYYDCCKSYSYEDSDNNGNGCPNKYLLDDDYYDVVNLNYKHHEYAFCINRKNGSATWTGNKVYSFHPEYTLTYKPGSTAWDDNTIPDKK